MENLKLVQDSSLVIESQEDTARVVSAPSETLGNSPPSARYILRNEGDSRSVVPQLTERFHVLTNLKWSTATRVGDVIWEADFPSVLFDRSSRIPNLAFLTNYCYWNCDFEIELEITAPKMTYGVLVIGWCFDYRNMSLAEKELRRNMGCLWNMDHHLVHAETNAKINFLIPFKSYKPYGRVDKSSITDDLRKMVTVFVSVLSPLKINLGQAVVADIQVRARLSNLKVSGLRKKPQMLSSFLVSLGERLLSRYLPDPNRDLPTDIREPKQVVLRNTGAMCVGSGNRCTTIPLRLNSSGTTPFASLVDDELKVDFLKRKWGLAGNFDWKTDQQQSDVLKVINVSPIVNVRLRSDEGSADLHFAPNLTVLSSAFSYWRGSLEYKFVCSANMFAVGKLLVAFVPGPKKDAYDIDDIASSYYTTYELGASLEFTFVTPFIYDSHYVRIVGSDYDKSQEKMGCIVCMAYSSLGLPSFDSRGVNSVTFTIFVRGGEDFELAVPCQPLYGIGTNRLVNRDISYISAKQGYGSVYFGNWRGFYGEAKYILRYGTTPDHIAQFNRVKPGTVYKVTKPNPKLVLVFAQGDKYHYLVPAYFACPQIGDGYDDYLAPIFEENVEKYMDKPSNDLFIDYVKDSPDYVDANALKLKPFSVKKPAEKQSGEVALGVEKLSMNMNQFGEVFTDLKDLFRRFNVYADSYRLLPKDFDIGMVIFKIPIQTRPLHLSIDNDGNLDVYRRLTREGPIGLLSNCFRFFRGSLRFKLVFSTCNVTVGVFHDPNDFVIGHIIDLPRALSTNTMINQGCAGIVQNLQINNVIDVEVPYYCPTDFIKNGSDTFDHIMGPGISPVTSLGSIKVVCMTAVKEELPLSVNVYFALGDDARYHTFNGYLPVVRVKQISDMNKDFNVGRGFDARRMKNAKEMKAFLKRKKNLKKQSDSEYSQLSDAEPQMGLFDIVGSSAIEKQLLEGRDEILSNVKSVGEKTEVMLTTVENSTKTVEGNVSHLCAEAARSLKTVEDTAKKVGKATEEVSLLAENSNIEVVKTGKILSKVNELLDGPFVNGIQDKIANVMEQIGSFLSSVKGYASAVVEDIKLKVFNTLTNLAHILVNPSLGTVVIAVTSTLISLGLVSINAVFKIRERLSSILKRIYGKVVGVFCSNEQPQNKARKLAEPQSMFSIMEDNEISAAISGLLALLAGSYKVGSSLVSAPVSYFKNELMKDLRNTAQTSNALFIFFRNSLSMFVKMYTYISHKIMDPKDRSLALLVDMNKQICEWYTRSSDLTNTLKREIVKRSPRMILEVFVLRSLGERFCSDLLGGNTAVKQQLLLIKDMLNLLRKFCDELASEHLAPQVRFEPFCFQLFGGTKVGKSFVSRSVILKMLNAVGIKSNDPIFTRNPGPAFLNGIQSQPCFYVDDFLQVMGNGCAEESICELFCLKSSAVFNPNIAQLEKKNLRYNPALVVLCSNAAYYDGHGINLLDINALHRRRDALWEMDVKQEFKVNGIFEPQKVERKVLESFDHCRFRRYLYPNDSSMKHARSEWIGYEEFLQESIKQFVEYYEFEMENYRKRLMEASQLLPDIHEEQEFDDYMKSCEELFVSYNGQLEGERLSDLPPSSDIMNRIRVLKGKLSSTMIKGDAVNSSRKLSEVATDLCAQPQSGPIDIEKEPLIKKKRNKKEKIEMDQFSHLYRGKMPRHFDPERVDKVAAMAFLKERFVDNLPEDETINGEFEGQCCHMSVLDPNEYIFIYWDSLKRKYVSSNEENKIKEFTEDVCEGPCLWKYDEYKRSFEVFMRERLVTGLLYGESCIEYSFKHRVELAGIIKEVFKCKPPVGFINNSVKVVVPLEGQNLLTKLKATPGQLLEYSKRCVKGFFGLIREYWKYVLLGLGVASMGLFYYTRGKVEENGRDPYVPVSAQTIYEGRSNLESAKAKLLQTSKLRGFVAQPQMASISDASRLVRRNTGTISYARDSKRMTSANYLAIRGHNLIIPGHMLEEMICLYDRDEDFTFMITLTGSATRVVNFAECKSIYDSKVNSLAILCLPKSIPAFRNLINHIATEKEHRTIAPDNCVLFKRVNGDMEIIHTNVAIEQEICVSSTEMSEAYTLPACYSYPFGGDGMCGSVLARTSPSFKIIGIHIAGNRSIEGYAEPLLFEHLKDIEGIKVAEPQFDVTDNSMVVLEGEFVDLGKVPREYVVRVSPNTAFEKTEMHGRLYPVVKQPAILSNRDPRASSFEKTPLSYGVSKHGHPPIPFKTEVLRESSRALSEKLVAICKPILMGPDIGPEMSDQQIFGGIANVDECKHLELHTSEGYPLQLERPNGFHNKSWLFQFETTEKGNILHEIHPLLKAEMTFKQEIRKGGGIPSTIFVDSLKDELVKEKKLAPGGTRVFSVSPIEFTWTIKKYFGWFQAAYSRHRIESETAVGINPDSYEWTKLLRKLNEVENETESGPMFVTGDYTSFGDCLQSECIIAAFEIMIDWYRTYFKIDAEGVRIRRLLCLELINAIHLAQNFMYKKLCGIPSGFALTVEINSIVNCLYMRCAWIELTKKPLALFERDVRLITYGDDLLMKVSSKSEDNFNFFSIKEYLASYAIRFTSASKIETDNRKSIPLQEVTFLKRGFEGHPFRRGLVLAPLPLESVTEMLNWYRKNLSKTSETRLMENCRGSLLNAYGRGPIFYMDLRSKLITWWRERKGKHFRCETWRERDSIIFDGY